MAIAVVSSTEVQAAGATNPRTTTFDIGTRTNGLLVVPYVIHDVSTRTITAATWNGVAMTKIAEVSRSGTESAFTSGILYLVAPTDGNQTLSFTLSGSGAATNTSVFPIWFDGAKTSSTLDDSDSLASGTDPTISLDSTEATTIAVAVYFSEQNAVLSSDQGTEYQTHDFGAVVCGAKWIAIAAASNQVLSWSGTDDDNSISAANFKSEPGGAATPIRVPGRRMLLGVG